MGIQAIHKGSILFFFLSFLWGRGKCHLRKGSTTPMSEAFRESIDLFHLNHLLEVIPLSCFEGANME